MGRPSHRQGDAIPATSHVTRVALFHWRRGGGQLSARVAHMAAVSWRGRAAMCVAVAEGKRANADDRRVVLRATARLFAAVGEKHAREIQ